MKDRLSTIADMVSSGAVIADIGTDHGFLPINLVRTGKVPYAIAMDIAEGPLKRAKDHIAEAGLGDKIECRLSDGFDNLKPGEVKCAVIAGMGGDMVSDIIRRKPDAADELILSPHTHYEKVRKTLRDSRFRITDERMIEDINKYYVFIKAVRIPIFKYNIDTDDPYVNSCKESMTLGPADHTEVTGITGITGVTGLDDHISEISQMYDYFGPVLIKRKDGILHKYLLKEIDKYKGIDQKQAYLNLVKSTLLIMG